MEVSILTSRRASRRARQEPGFRGRGRTGAGPRRRREVARGLDPCAVRNLKDARASAFASTGRAPKQDHVCWSPYCDSTLLAFMSYPGHVVRSLNHLLTQLADFLASVADLPVG